jgi:hypothetical protein
MVIFLSYASEQRDIAEQIKLALVGSGHNVFFDRDSLPAGDEYHLRIRKAVEESDAFIFLISPESVAHGSYALTELKYARERWPDPRGAVLPVMIERTEYGHIPAYLKAISVLEPEGSAAAEVAAEFHKRLPTGLVTQGQHDKPAIPDVGAARLDGNYRRRYDDAALGMGKTDYISFTADGRFEERGFLAAALGSQILPSGSVLFFDSHAGGKGTFSLRPETLELNYTSNSYNAEHQVADAPISLSFNPLDRIAGTNVVAAAILNTRYTFIRIGTKR